MGRQYYLNTGQLICIGPNETPQLLHRDELNWPQAAGNESEVTVTAIFALTDFTEENGATVIAPGSHRWPGELPPVNPADACQATMQAGSALLYSGKVIHGGGPNSSADQWRVGLHAGFELGWLRVEENHQLTTSLESAKRLPEHAQRMLGFRSFNPPTAARLGMVNYEDAGARLTEQFPCWLYASECCRRCKSGAGSPDQKCTSNDKRLRRRLRLLGSS